MRRDRVEPDAGLVEVAALLPEPPEREREPCRDLGEWPRDRVIQGGPQVVVVAFQSIEPGSLVRTGQMRSGPFGEREERRGMPVADVVALATRLEHLARELRDGVEHHEARLVGRVVDAQQALVDERRQPIEHVEAQVRTRAAHGLGGLEVAAAAEHREPVHEAPATLVEQVVAPGDRPAERLLPLGQVTRSSGQQGQVVLQPGEDLVGCQELDPRGGELDRERHPVEPRGDPGDGRGVGIRDAEARPDRGRARDEETHGLERVERLEVELAQLAGQVQSFRLGQSGGVRRCREARDRVLLLPGDAQRGTARRDDRHVLAATQHLTDDGSRTDDLLEVVEQEEHPLRADRVDEDVDRRARRVVGGSERPRDRRGHERWVADGLERDEPDPVRVGVRGRRRDLQ